MTFQSNLNAAQSETQQNNIMNSFIQYYVDNEINKLKQILVDAAPESLDTLHELGEALAAEITRATAAEGVLDQHITDEEVARAAAVTALEAAIAAEQARAEAAEASELAAREAAVTALQAALDAFVASEAATDAAQNARLDVLEADPTTKTYVDAQDQVLFNRIVLGEDADAALDTRVTAIEGAGYATEAGVTIVAGDLRTDFETDDATEQSARIAGDASTLSSANTYTDTKVSDLVNGAGAALDTLKELGDALTDNDSEIAALVTQIGTVESGLAQEVTDRTNGDSALDTRVSALELDPVTFTQVAGAVSAEASSRSSADTALSGRLDTLEADPTTKTYVDTQDALALPKTGGTINVDNSVTFNYDKELTIGSFRDLNLVSGQEIYIEPEEDFDIRLVAAGSGSVKVSGNFVVNTNAKFGFNSNLTKVQNTLRGTDISIGNNIEMNPAAAGGRVEINGGLLLDASDLVNAANDTAAAAAGIVVGQVYHNSGVLRIRLS